jgi:hypothetical protein
LQRELIAPTNNTGPYGQVAWSWPPDAEVRATRESALSRYGGQQARRTEEIAKQPFKPSRREGRVVRLDLWYLPPAFF